MKRDMDNEEEEDIVKVLWEELARTPTGSNPTSRQQSIHITSSTQGKRMANDKGRSGKLRGAYSPTGATKKNE
jgi:hypothetical protein